MNGERPARVAIITGASKGIGLEIARRLAGAGLGLCITGRTAATLDAARRELARHTAVVAVVGDVANEDDVARTVDAAESLGPVHALVNNAAARGPTKPLHEYSTAEFTDTVDANLIGAFLFVKYAVPAMIERGAGSIINIGSIAGVEAYPLRSAYCATKWALVGLTRTLAKEYGPHGIRTNLVAPGPTEGEGADGVIAARAAKLGVPTETMRAAITADMPLRRFVTADETAATVAFLISEHASGINGQSICVSGGIEV